MNLKLRDLCNGTPPTKAVLFRTTQYQPITTRHIRNHGNQSFTTKYE